VGVAVVGYLDQPFGLVEPLGDETPSFDLGSDP